MLGMLGPGSLDAPHGMWARAAGVPEGLFRRRKTRPSRPLPPPHPSAAIVEAVATAPDLHRGTAKCRTVHILLQAGCDPLQRCNVAFLSAHSLPSFVSFLCNSWH